MGGGLPPKRIVCEWIERLGRVTVRVGSGAQDGALNFRNQTALLADMTTSSRYSGNTTKAAERAL